jgi:thiol-disulfide isomerase/thioredoxin
MSRLAAFLLACACVAGCTRSHATADAGHGHVRLLPAPAYADAAVVIADAQASSEAVHRRLLVYVGASWCEPCRRFHEAAQKGELDAAFGDLDLLVFDTDVDNERLASAGYFSTFIPLVALPGPDGRASGKQMEGSVKGPGAVADMTPRLQALLAR